MDTRDMRPRARRIPIAIPLWYRERGTTEWRAGMTIDASHSGVLFWSDGIPPAAGRPLDFILTLPPNPGSRPVHIRCSGQIVRGERNLPAGRGRAVAASLDGCAFGRGVPVDRRAPAS